MIVQIGNPKPHDKGVPVDGPALTTVKVNDGQDEDGAYTASYTVGADAAEVKDHLFDNPGPVCHLPGNTLLVSLIRSWPDNGLDRPTWVAVEAENRDPAEAEDLERFLSEFWKCERGVPSDLEATHYTYNGPPGVGPAEGA